MKMAEIVYSGFYQLMHHACLFDFAHAGGKGAKYICSHGNYPVSSMPFASDGSPKAIQNDAETGALDTFLAAVFGAKYFM